MAGVGIIGGRQVSDIPNPGKEYMTIPDMGIRDAGVVHLVCEQRGPNGELVKHCAYEVYTPPDETCKQLVFCRACYSSVYQR